MAKGDKSRVVAKKSPGKKSRKLVVDGLDDIGTIKTDD